ncbi:sigma-70 family RNA polymerase sigma factor [Gloeobacter morelensis]|uniref:Sigma-70 family RNA polymerase sigma factor n=1 Tax=Gloeobacter morelensis MG652769 TaxID=2781736 RepID=A0ABY3PML2_9CYAN|nr:sigma-70 family RNA polymerase sigma factor [Gloeobacter morelensis]UFP94928.1 sigma-70 family RNA polymerase sigma factor [Gloeobacter morelensis MG652769]
MDILASANDFFSLWPQAIYSVEEIRPGRNLLPTAGGNQRNAMDPPSDAEIYADLKRGSASALGVLYDRHGRLVYRLAVRILANNQEAEDLTQEVFLILWQKKAYDPARGTLSNYLLTLTRSRAIDRVRSRGSNLRFLQKWTQELGTGTAPGPTPFERVANAEVARQVKTALEQLPKAQRQALELAYYEGLSQSEIASRLETPLGTVKTRSRQGLLKLRNLLRDLVG